MPSMTAIVLERLLEPNGSRSAAASDRDDSENGDKHLSARQLLSLFSPAPSAAPPPPRFPDPYPSPYVVTGKSPHRGHNFSLAAGEPLAGRGKRDEESGRLDASWRGEERRDGLERGDLDKDVGEDDDWDDFLSPRETRSVTNFCSCESSSAYGNRTPNQTEFYDAIEDFIWDGSASQSSPSLSTKSQSELHALQVNLIEEIERRKTADMALLHMQNQWKKLAESLCQVGVAFPAIQQDGGVHPELDPAQLCQEILYTRFVSEAIQRGLSRAGAEATAEAVVDAKNHEISRLQHRLNYYKAVNREMSLRNQEAELARQQRLRRSRQRRIWSCIGLSVTLGASLLASLYLEHSIVDDLLTLLRHNDHAETLDNGSD